jgi:hypothetical protein
MPRQEEVDWQQHQTPHTHKLNTHNYIIINEFIIQSFDCTKSHQSRRY